MPNPANTCACVPLWNFKWMCSSNRFRLPAFKKKCPEHTILLAPRREMCLHEGMRPLVAFLLFNKLYTFQWFPSNFNKFRMTLTRNQTEQMLPSHLEGSCSSAKRNPPPNHSSCGVTCPCPSSQHLGPPSILKWKQLTAQPGQEKWGRRKHSSRWNINWN